MMTVMALSGSLQVLMIATTETEIVQDFLQRHDNVFIKG
jgi:hypothetical protein